MTEAEQHLIDVAVLMAQELQEYVDVGIECTGSNAAELATQELLKDWEEAYAACQFDDDERFAGLRRAEVFSRKVSDCVSDGLILVRTKGSEGEITAWTPRLRAAVDAARAFNQSAPTPIGGAYLIHSKRGVPIEKNAFDSAWRRFMDKVQAAGIERFTLHDLKSKGVSEQKSNWAGHKSSRMRKTYVRKLQIVEPPA